MQSDKSAMIDPQTVRTAGGVADPSGGDARRSRPLIWILLILAVVLFAAWLVMRGVTTRVKAASALRQETQELAIPTVAVVHPRLGAMRDEIVLPGNIQAFTDAPIYARTSGYLKKWYFDIWRSRQGRATARRN